MRFIHVVNYWAVAFERMIFCSELGSKNDKSSCFKGGISFFDLTQFEVGSNYFEKILK